MTEPSAAPALDETAAPVQNRALSPALGIIALALVSLAAKLYCATATIGSSDVMIFRLFAEWIHKGGLIATYQITPDFNHTPLTGWYIHQIYVAAENGKDVSLFALLMRLPAIFSDVIATGALLWFQKRTGRPGWLALGLFAASPVAFMISGYHGNLDSVVAAGVLLAGIACAAGQPALCGLFLGLSCNIKVIPLLVAPVFFFYWMDRRRLPVFLASAAIVILAGWSYPLTHIPGVFLKNVLGYPSYWGLWGIPYFLRETGAAMFHKMSAPEFSPIQSVISGGLKLLVIASAFGLGWAGRKCAPEKIFRTLALVWAVFFVFAPGFGPQYLVWIAPCLLLASDRWYAAVTAASSVALYIFYTLISGGTPWYKGFAILSTKLPQFGPWFAVVWGTLAAYLGYEVWSEWKGKRASSLGSLRGQFKKPLQG